MRTTGHQIVEKYGIGDFEFALISVLKKDIS